jgi:Ca2+-binding RTX toxin-like protein
VLQGLAGVDTLNYAVYAHATSGVTLSLSLATAQNVGGGQGVDTVTRMTGAFGSNFGDRLIGGGEAVTGRLLIGLDGNDTLQASDGRGMAFWGGEGDDLLVGGAGLDSANYDGVVLAGQLVGGATGGVNVSLAIAGPQNVGGGAGVDTLQSIEQLRGGAFNDTLTGDTGANTIYGAAGADSIATGAGDDLGFGELGNDSLFGGDGADTLSEFAGANMLRGEAGDDRLIGGAEFDDLHGNMGNDTVTGAAGDDWVVGGKDNDSLAGDAGGDIVFGNLGADTCEGGAGDDVVRGGQGDDIVRGGDGNDFVSGDRGSDTVSGGLGADTFHTFGDNGADRVIDFSRAQGDRVLVSEGATWTVSQQGADVIIDLTGGGRMVLADVQLSSLTDGWIGAV